VLITISLQTWCSDATKKALNDSLIIAAQKNSPELVNNLIVSGANINTKSKDGDTPLIIAGKTVQKVVKLPGAPSIIERDKALEIILTLIKHDANMAGFEKYATDESLKMYLRFNDKVQKYLATLPGYKVEEKPAVIAEKQPQPTVITQPISTGKKVLVENPADTQKLDTEMAIVKKEQTDQTKNPLKADVVKTAKPEVNDKSAELNGPTK
jgi:hypothetical protein